MFDSSYIFKWVHLNGFSLVGVLLWFFQWFDLEKLLSHLVHFNDFSPLWVLCWILKTDVEKLLSHLVHLNAFSPVWFLSGFFLSNLILRSSHIVHLCEFSPVFSGNQMWNSSYHTLMRSLSELFENRGRQNVGRFTALPAAIFRPNFLPFAKLCQRWFWVQML